MDLFMLMFLIVYCVLFIHMVVDLYFQGVYKSWNAIVVQYDKDSWVPNIENLNQWTEHVRLVNRSYDLFNGRHK